MSANIVVILVGAGMLGFSLYKIWQTARFMQRRSASQTWPAVAADIVSKRVAERRSSKSGTSYFPEITYHYNVMGQDFSKDTRLGGMYSRQSAAKAIDSLGATIAVHYNPNDPKEHVSEKEKINVWDILLIVGSMALGLAALIPQIF